MKRLIIFTVLISFAVNTSATDIVGWSSESAFLLEPGQRQIGVFQPWRIGIRDNIEITTHPALFILLPNLSVKMAHGNINQYILGSRHTLTYPTPLLNLLAKEGIGGMISPEFDIPPIIHHKAEILLSRQFSENLLLNTKTGLAVAVKIGDLDSRTSIDLPVIYPRWATWYSGFGFILGGELIYQVSPVIGIQTDGDIFLHSKETGGLAFEHKSLVFLSRKENRRFAIGYKLTYGNYPFGKQIHLLGPIFDFQWSWSK